MDIDKDTQDQDKQVFGVRTNKEAIDMALQDAVLRRQQLDAIDALAALPVDADPQPIHHGQV